MSDTAYLADASAIGRMKKPTVAARIQPLALGRRLALCAPVIIELLRSTRAASVAETRRSLAAYPTVRVHDATFQRAIEVVELLAAQSQHLAPSLPDLLVAAAAEANGLTVLHYDKDFDLIASVTGQPTDWVVPPGSAD